MGPQPGVPADTWCTQSKTRGWDWNSLGVIVLERVGRGAGQVICTRLRLARGVVRQGCKLVLARVC